MKAIETIYKGYRFRSRLEARWAIFFDVLGIKWEYEKEGYDLDGARYLPDFWLSEMDCFIEIKGQEPTPDEMRKGQSLSRQSGKSVYILAGNVGMEDIQDTNTAALYIGSGIMGGSVVMSHCAWYECDICSTIGLRPTNDLLGEFHVQFLACKCHLEFMDCPLYERVYYLKHRLCVISDRLIEAYTTARQARFEHGAQGIYPVQKLSKSVEVTPIARKEVLPTETIPACFLCGKEVEHYTDEGTPCCGKHFPGQQRIEHELARLAAESNQTKG